MTAARRAWGVADADAPFEEWERGLGKIAARLSCTTWEMADWLALGDARHPGERVRAAAARHGIGPGKFSNYCLVANTWPHDSRRITPTFSHHLEVARLPEASRERLLDEAEAGGWSHRDLRAAAGKERRALDRGRLAEENRELREQLKERDGKAGRLAKRRLAAGLKVGREEIVSTVDEVEATLTNAAIRQMHGNERAALARELVKRRDALAQAADKACERIMGVAERLDPAAARHTKGPF